jgi:hypothetical protein
MGTEGLDEGLVTIGFEPFDGDLYKARTRPLGTEQRGIFTFHQTGRLSKPLSWD